MAPQRLDLNIAASAIAKVSAEMSIDPGTAICSIRAATLRRLANDRVVHPEVAPDRAHDDFARIESDPDLDRDALGSTNGLCA